MTKPEHTRDQREYHELPDEIARVIREQPHVGVDEAGRGTWAGPVIAAAAAVPAGWTPPPGLTDSKLMSSKAGHKRRIAIYEQYINDDTVVIGIGRVDADEIDQICIDAAQAKAQAEAIRATFWRLVYPPFCVVDGILPPAIGPPEIAEVMLLPKGDLLVPAVSLASVCAKVVQVRLMKEFDAQYPDYGFAHHRGYGTAEHKIALDELGPCPIHRRCYRPVAKAVARREESKEAWELSWELLDEG
jgi:ribonuclease HII